MNFGIPTFEHFREQTGSEFENESQARYAYDGQYTRQIRKMSIDFSYLIRFRLVSFLFIFCQYKHILIF